jgi:SAM-dependent methyltransferase
MNACSRDRKSPEIPDRVIPAQDTVPAALPSPSAEPRKLDIFIGEYEDPDRGTWQNPELVLQKFGPLGTSAVADIGCGTGYFTLLLARRAGKVIAIDIESEFLDYLEERKLEFPPSSMAPIETRLSVEDDPNLGNGEVDAALMVNVYYYLNNRTDYMSKVREGLKPDGILVLVEFKPGDLPLGPVEHKIPVQVVVSELKAAGFRILETDSESLQYQYIVKAQR